MKSPKLFLVVSGLMVIAVSIFPAQASAQKSFDGQHDISRLMTIAEREFNPSGEDAILLLDALRYDWTDEGRLTKHVHRIIWINTDVATEIYGDHRIAYDSGHCIFKLKALRTWRDEQWWETGPTGIVETLPRRLREAYDYTNLRDMMLLHNGIELPCILEVAYSIEDKSPFRQGAEGMWLFNRSEPAVLSWFALGVPKGESPNVRTTESVPDVEKSTDDESGLDIYWWKMGPVPAQARPHTDDPAAYSPHISWSTWESWTEFGNHLKNTFVGLMKLDSALIQSLDSLSEKARTDAEKTELIAEFTRERTAFIDYSDEPFRPFPRPAFRTYQTAYGHRLDRAILAAALFEKSGLQARPVFLGRGYGEVDEDIPTLARMDGIGVWVSGEDVEAYYNPASGEINTGLAHTFRKSIWFPGEDANPGVRLNGDNEAGRFELQLKMKLEAENDTLFGEGLIVTANCLNAHDRSAGLSDESRVYLNEVISGLIEGAKVTEYSFSRFDLFKVTAGFKFAFKKPEEDDFGRIMINFGEPAGGLFEHLPEDAALYDGSRSSPVQLQCLLTQKIKLDFEFEGLEPVYLPEDSSLSSAAGDFAIKTTAEDDRLSITRELKLMKTSYPPDEWTELRALLLADRHDRNRMLLFKKSENQRDD